MRALLIIYLFVLFGCKKEAEDPYDKDFIWKSMIVTATAYNSTTTQTSDNPHITAYGDSIYPGLKYIAVSNDLVRKGLKHNTPVVIEGFDGYYFVKDRMHPRWRNKIDIYMGLNIEAAREWGRKKVCIDYAVPINTKK